MEAFSVLRGKSQFTNAFEMGLGAVAGVDFKAIARILLGKFVHIAVTEDLRQDGCGGNACDAAIALHDWHLQVLRNTADFKVAIHSD